MVEMPEVVERTEFMAYLKVKSKTLSNWLWEGKLKQGIAVGGNRFNMSQLKYYMTHGNFKFLNEN